jgi:hypothetical protein
MVAAAYFGSGEPQFRNSTHDRRVMSTIMLTSIYPQKKIGEPFSSA